MIIQFISEILCLINDASKATRNITISSALSALINCLQSNHFISILYEIKLGYNKTKCFNQELHVNFFSGKKFFFPTNRPWKILESYRKRQYYFVPPNTYRELEVAPPGHLTECVPHSKQKVGQSWSKWMTNDDPPLIPMRLSPSLALKGTLFWEFSDTHVNTYRELEVPPPGIWQSVSHTLNKND